jgi:hypothetical protein
MIRNRSQAMISSISSACSDIESNSATTTDGRAGAGSTKMLGGTKRWQWFGIVLFVGALMYVVLLISSPAPLKEHMRSKETSHEQLTIVMNTFRRHEMMLGKASF